MLLPEGEYVLELDALFVLVKLGVFDCVTLTPPNIVAAYESACVFSLQ